MGEHNLEWEKVIMIFTSEFWRFILFVMMSQVVGSLCYKYKFSWVKSAIILLVYNTICLFLCHIFIFNIDFSSVKPLYLIANISLPFLGAIYGLLYYYIYKNREKIIK